MLASYFNELKANNKSQTPPSVSFKRCICCLPNGGICRPHRTRPISLLVWLTTLAFSVVPVSQAFAQAVPDACEPFLPPVYLMSAYSSLSSPLNPRFLWKSSPALWDTPSQGRALLLPSTHLSFAPLHLFVRLFNQYLSRRLPQGRDSMDFICVSYRYVPQTQHQLGTLPQAEMLSKYFLQQPARSWVSLVPFLFSG